MNRPEQVLQLAVADFLRVAVRRPDRWWWVPNGTHIPNGKTRGLYQRMGLTAGVSDLHFAWAFGSARQFPAYGVIELKAGKGVERVDQEKFGDDMTKLGHTYAVCRAVGEVEATLLGWDFPLRAKLLPTGVTLRDMKP